MNLYVMDFFSLDNRTLCRPCSVHISDPCTCMAHVKSVEGCPNRVARFVLNRADIRNPDSSCTDNTLFLEHFFDFYDL